jgi:hypothetical protein
MFSWYVEIGSEGLLMIDDQRQRLASNMTKRRARKVAEGYAVLHPDKRITIRRSELIPDGIGGHEPQEFQVIHDPEWSEWL